MVRTAFQNDYHAQTSQVPLNVQWLRRIQNDYHLVLRNPCRIVANHVSDDVDVLFHRVNCLRAMDIETEVSPVLRAAFDVKVVFALAILSLALALFATFAITCHGKVDTVSTFAIFAVFALFAIFAPFAILAVCSLAIAKDVVVGAPAKSVKDIRERTRGTATATAIAYQ